MRAVYERNDRFEGHENGRIRRLNCPYYEKAAGIHTAKNL